MNRGFYSALSKAETKPLYELPHYHLDTNEALARSSSPCRMIVDLLSLLLLKTISLRACRHESRADKFETGQLDC